MGYLDCGLEIMAQIKELGLELDYIVCASGSGGTHAGLLSGMLLHRLLKPSMERGMQTDMKIPEILGINVRAEKAAQERKIKDLIKKMIEYARLGKDVPDKLVTCFDEYVGEGYSLPTEEMKEAVRLSARLDGILLDPVYSGKAMAGLIDLIRKGHFSQEDKVLFIHTGGVPALYHYADYFL